MLRSAGPVGDRWGKISVFTVLCQGIGAQLAAGIWQAVHNVLGMTLLVASIFNRQYSCSIISDLG